MDIRICIVYPDQLFIMRGVFDIMAAIIRIHSCIASREVKGASVCAAKEDNCAGCTLVEIQPLFGLEDR